MSRSTRPRRKVPPPKPIWEREYYREEMKIKAREVEAGDQLQVRKGTVRTWCHICEVGIDHLGVEVVYNDTKDKSGSGVGRVSFARGQRIIVRRWVEA